MQRDPSVLMVVAEDWYFLSHRIRLAEEARRQGLRVIVAAPPGQRGNEIIERGFEYITIALARQGVEPLRELASVADLTRVVRRVRPGLVHLVGAKPIVYGAVAARLAGDAPVLCAIAGLGYLYLGENLARKAMRSVYEGVIKAFIRSRRSAKVLIQNDDDAGLLLARSLVREDQLVRVVGSGVDTARFIATPEPPSPPVVVLAHTRMLWDKGIAELVEAARLLRVTHGERVIVRLVGEPDPANPASIPRERLNEWAREGAVEWLGRREDIPEQLANCHIACLPSYREGAPLSLLEAAAAGRPIVATDVPGCRAVVEHQGNGLLVPVRDAAALAKAISVLVLDAEQRRRLGCRGRARAEAEFASPITNSRIVEIYKSMLDGSISN